MARYIKVNPKVAKYLHLENDRLQVKDGNYILWQGDMTAFGPLPMLNDTLAKIGGIALLPHEAKQEQDGTFNRPLPVATDERFIIEEPAASAAQPDEAEAVTDEAEGQAPTPESVTDGEGESESKDGDKEPTDEADADGESEETEKDNTETE